MPDEQSPFSPNSPMTWPGQGPNPGQRFSQNPSKRGDPTPTPTDPEQSLRPITVWPGSGPNMRERGIQKQKVICAPPTKLGNKATCPNWFDYDLSKQSLIEPGRVAIPSYDGGYQAGSLAGVYNWNKDPTFAGNKPQTGWIEGYVKKLGVILPGAWVHLYHRDSGKLIGSVRSNQQGYFKFDHLDPNKDNYYVLAVDPDNEYNVVVFDRVEP